MTETQLWPIVWTLASMTLAVLVILFVSPALLARLHASLGGRLGVQLLRLLYFIGLPYAALLTGSLAPIDLGLTGAGGAVLGWDVAAWLRGLSITLTVGVLVVLPISLASWQLARATHGMVLGTDDRSVGAVLVEALYAEVHWAFYRTAPLILLENAYAAALIGMVLVAVEWCVELIRNGLSHAPEDRQRWLRRVLLLAVSATLFVLTRNLWLLIGLHLVLELIWKAWLGRLAHHPIETVAAPIDPRPDADVRPLH
jgi:hypothetical protein